MARRGSRTPIPASAAAAATLVVALLASPSAAVAIDPDGARYLDDVDEIFWFVQISDTHVGADLGYGTQDTDHLAWVVNDAVDVILPVFVVLTGDIVDGTNGLFVPTGQYQAEWDEYRGVVDDAGMDISYFHDIVGNHDTYNDDGATYYLDNSLLGTEFGTWHETWTYSTGSSDYVFVGLCSADVTGSFPGLDSPGITDDELLFLDESLVTHADADLAFVFSHHPLHALDFGGDGLMSLLADHRVSLWSNGHDHDHVIEAVTETVHFNLDTAGKGTVDNIAVVTVDHDGIAVKATDIGAWPMVQVTAPVDRGLGGDNPHAYPISITEAEAFVRAVVFDADPDVMAWMALDDGPLEPMTEVAPTVWRGTFDATLLAEGVHQVRVEAESPSGADSHTITVEIRTTACADGVDNDGDGLIDHAADDGCWGPSDDDEAGTVDPGDDDDSAADDDDSATDDDDSAADDDDSAPADDDDATDDDDSALSALLEGDGCSCELAAAPPITPLLLLALAAAGLRRRRG